MPLPPVFTKLLFSGTLAPGTTDCGNPPEGFVWIVTDMCLTPFTLGVATEYTFRLADMTGALLWSSQSPWLVRGLTERWTGRQLVNRHPLPGTALLGEATGFLYLRITGYELSTP